MTGPRRLNLIVRREPHAIAVALVLAVIIGIGVLARAEPAPAPASAPVAAVASAAPLDAQSSSWYCTGAAGAGEGQGTVYLTNTADRAVEGVISVDSDSGKTAIKSVALGPRAEIAFVPSSIESGNWLATRVDLNGGGVVVSQAVGNASVWAEAPCSTVTSPSWYFASGSTMGGSLLFISLFNPTQTTAVVDLNFVTPQGVLAPPPFEGLILPPGQLVVAEINQFVQSQATVSTIVTARSGRVVADELQAYTVNGVQGASLRLGSPRVETDWAVPRSVDAAGGATSIDIFNPTSVPQLVTVLVRLPSSPVSPFSEMLPSDSTWFLDTSSQSRIPVGTDFSATVLANGPGVVVDRVTQTQSSAPAPQWGTVSAVAASTSESPARRWVIPGPGVSGSPAVEDAAPLDLCLQNLTDTPMTVRLSVLTPRGITTLAVRTLGAREFSVIDPKILSKAGLHPVLVSADGALAIYEDELPAGLPGAVALAGIPTS
jgi:hypothetical protein